MVNALIRWSLHNRAAVLAMAVLLCGVGLYVSAAMPVDVFPDLTAPTVTILTEAHGMAPTEVETQITLPIEAALNGASHVRRVRSSTAVGLSIVWVEFDWGTDLYAARQIVAEKTAAIAGSLPPEVQRPILTPVSSIMGEIMFIAVVSDRHGPMDLRTQADVVVRRRLLSVPGVSQVTVIGGEEKQYQVALRPDRMHAYGVSMDDVSRALAGSNENLSAGFINQGGSEYLITGVGRARNEADLERTVVALREGVPVTVRDVADVRIGAAPKRGEGSANGRAAVILAVQKQPGANTLALTRDLDVVIADLQTKLPAGMTIDSRIFRQADFIEVAVRNVLHALRDGAILVVVIVLLFLANVRATLITLTAIPLSLLAAVLTLQALGATINTMTLGGMAIAIGALVDDAIIDVENVLRRLREDAGRSPAISVVFEASREIRGSIVYATLIIMVVFVPLFFLSGVEGRLMQPLGAAYIVALFASLVVAVTVTPVLCLLLLPRSKAVREGREPRVVGALKAAYARVLDPALNQPWAATLPAVALFVIALGSGLFMGRAFLPDFNEGALTIGAVTLPGTNLKESDELGRVLERVLLRHPEVVAVGRRTGRAEEDEHAQGVEGAELDVTLRAGDRTKDRFLEDLRKDLAQVPGVSITIGQPISHRIDHILSGTRASIAVKIFGPDLYRLRALAERAKRAMQEVPGVVDLSVEQQSDIPALLVRFDRDAMARHGLTMVDVTHALEAAVQGHKVSAVLEGRVSFDVVVRTGAGWTIESIGDLPMDTPSGAKVPLKEVAHVTRATGPNVISREQVERKIVVSCNVAGRDVASVVADIARRVDPVVAREAGYRVVYGGQFESAREAGRVLLVVGAAVVLGIGLLLHLAFRAPRDAAIVMVNLPLALIGGAAGVFVSGGVLSVASIIGFITVFGIATRNGLMLVSHIRHLQESEGVTDFREAVRRGALERLAPILMTALAAGLALVPLALGGGKPGNEIQTPMAIVILFGLLSSMVLNMLVVPALYLKFGRPISGGNA